MIPTLNALCLPFDYLFDFQFPFETMLDAFTAGDQVAASRGIPTVDSFFQSILRN